MKTAVIIPCYNEASNIGELVTHAKQYVDEVVVVDNGSYDETVKVAEKNGAKVFYSHRKGMGAAIKKGINSVEADCYVTMDGDGQHDPDEIPMLLNPIKENKADFVVGVRQDKNCMPKYRRYVNDLFSWIYNFNARLKLADVQCGFRAFSQAVTYIPIQSSGFGCVFELLIKTRKRNARIVPINVSCIYHDSLSKNSTLNPIKHGLIALSGVIRWRVWELF